MTPSADKDTWTILYELPSRIITSARYGTMSLPQRDVPEHPCQCLTGCLRGGKCDLGMTGEDLLCDPCRTASKRCDPHCHSYREQVSANCVMPVAVTL